MNSGQQKTPLAEYLKAMQEAEKQVHEAWSNKQDPTAWEVPAREFHRLASEALEVHGVELRHRFMR